MNYIKSFFGYYNAPKNFKLLVKNLRPNVHCLDIGANIGIYTKIFSNKGVTVHSYEPNPHAFKALKRLELKNKKIIALNKGVSNKTGKYKLYLYSNHKTDPLKWSTGSSLDKMKNNLSNDFIYVEIVDIKEILKNRFFEIIKVDVEGEEINILNSIIKNNLSNRFGNLFVEMHDEKYPHLKVESDIIRKKLIEKQITNIHLDWH